MTPIEYAADIAEPPRHLDGAFFEEVAESALRASNLAVVAVKFTMGSSTGENFCSQIYRVHMELRDRHSGRESQLAVIVKSMPPTETNQFVRDLGMYQKEKITYGELLPRMEMYLADGERFAARLYHGVKAPINTFAFEDLNTRQFVVASRESGLDLAHSRMIIRRLAQFHAISMLLAERRPDLFSCYGDGLLAPAGLADDKGLLINLIKGNAQALVDVVSKWQGYEDIAGKLRRYTGELRDHLVRSQAAHPDDIKVLNHGDLWVNNIMFKYERTTPVDLLFIDFQLCVWNSPGIDLNYFFYTSLQLDVLKHKRDDLVKDYYDTLSAMLRKHRYPRVPSYQQIRAEVQRREAYGFFANFAVFPLISMDKDASADASFDNFGDEEFSRNKLEQMHGSKRLEETMRYTLKRFDALGIWD